MKNIMRRVIELKVLTTQEEVVKRLNSFMMWGQIDDVAYNELMELAEITYNPPTPEVLPEEPIA